MNRSWIEIKVSDKKSACVFSGTQLLIIVTVYIRPA